MKAAIVLLAPPPIHNDVRGIVVELNQRAGVPFYAALLPPHVSLKQPFAFESLPQLDDYVAALAASLPPVEIHLDRFYHGAWGQTGILGLHVAETPTLRALHNRLNRELAALFADASAAHDGAEYDFHLTIEMGSTIPGDPFKAYYDALPTPQVDIRFTAAELGVFFYSQPDFAAASFITYRRLPLTGPA